MAPQTLISTTTANPPPGRAPPQLRVGVFSLWLFALFAVARFFENFWRQVSPLGMGTFYLVSSLVFLVVIVSMIVGIAKRHGWCRWVLIPLVTLDVLIAIQVAPLWLYANVAVGITEILKVLSAIIGVVLILTPRSRRWFRPEPTGTA